MKTKTTLRRAAVATVATLALIAGAVVAPADALASGGYNTGSGQCWDSTRMVAYPPSMTPEPNVPNAGVDANGQYWMGTGGGAQDVGFQVVLQRWTGSLWANFVVGPLKTRTVSYVPTAPENWYDTRTRTWSNGTTWFGPMQQGYFRFVYYLYWYLNGQISGQLNAVPAQGHFESRDDKMYVTGWSSYYWCRY